MTLILECSRLCALHRRVTIDVARSFSGIVHGEKLHAGAL